MRLTDAQVVRSPIAIICLAFVAESLRDDRQRAAPELIDLEVASTCVARLGCSSRP